MKLKTRLCAALSAMILLLAAAPSSVQSADKVASDRLLPPEVYVYFDIPSVADMRTGIDTSTFGKLLDDPAVADFKSHVKEVIAKYSKVVEEEIGVDVKSLISVPQGKFTFAIAEGADDLGVVTMLDFGENGETVDKVLAAAQKKLGEKSNVERTTESVDGIEIVVYTKTRINVVEEDDEFEEDSFEETEETEPEKDTLCYFIHDQHFIGASSIDLLKSVIERWNGEHESTLANKEEYKYILERCGEDGKTVTTKWYVDPLGLLRRSVHKIGPQAGMFLGFLPALGVNNLKAVGGVNSVGSTYDDAVTRTMIYVDLPTSGLLNLFQFPTTQQSPPKWIPAETVQYVQANWDVTKGYSAVEELVDGFRGPGALAKMIDALADKPNGPGVHVKKDVIDQLAGTVHMMNSVKDAEPLPQEIVLFAFELKNVDTMKGIIEKVAGSPGFPGEAREFQGANFYEMPAPPQGLGGEPSSLAFGVVFDHFVFASDVSLLENVIRASSNGTGLIGSSDYQTMSERFPEKTSMITFQRTAERMAPAYKMLKSGTLGQLLGFDEIDFTKLPEFDQIRKYFPLGAAYLVPDERGAIFVGFQKYSN